MFKANTRYFISYTFKEYGSSKPDADTIVTHKSRAFGSSYIDIRYDTSLDQLLEELRKQFKEAVLLNYVEVGEINSDSEQVRIRYGAKTPKFDVRHIVEDVDLKLKDIGDAEQAVLKDMYVTTAPLDKDHMVYIFLPKSYFNQKKDEQKETKKEDGSKVEGSKTSRLQP